MLINVIQSVWTIVAFTFFVGVLIWAWSSGQKQNFEEAANLPFNDEAPPEQQAKDNNDV